MDFRDDLIVQLHNTHLKPLGFRRKGRKCWRVTADEISVSAVLESSTWNTGEHCAFGINLQATHPSYEGDFLMNVSLRKYTDPPRHRWTVDAHQLAGPVSMTVATIFATDGLQLLHRMSSYEGIISLCQELGSTLWYEPYAWCLRRTGRREEAIAILREASDAAPHEGIRDHVQRLLRRYAA